MDQIRLHGLLKPVVSDLSMDSREFEEVFKSHARLIGWIGDQLEAGFRVEILGLEEL